ncbi:hypothetical protein GGR50DRAFT_692141 [Xylaria sp. CBS 124048]|nr:hypothetical protein GGR50DRAFT_692141 [Xylaria sp. CBS 124048]
MYNNPAGLIAGSVILWFISTSCVVLRCANNLRERKRSLTSDYFIVAGWAFATGLTALEIYGISVKALGYKIGSGLLDPSSVTGVAGQLNRAKHIQLAFLLVGVAALGFIKLSICFLYWHLFAQVTLRRFLIFWMIVNGVWATSFVLAGLLECGSHLWAAFSPTAYLKYCGSAIPSGYALTATDIGTDFITLLIPIPVVLKLNMSIRQKTLTLTAFLIGALSVGASIAKGYIYITSSLGIYKEDGLLILTGLSIWNLAEVHIGIIAACGPLLWPVLSRAVSHLTSPFSSKARLSFKASKTSSPSEDSHELPRFVRLSESEVHLAHGASRKTSFNPSEQDLEDGREGGRGEAK